MQFDFSGSFSGSTPRQINQQYITPSEHSLFRSWFGSGLAGAAKAKGRRAHTDLSVGALRAYHELARRQIARGLNGVQQARLDLVEQELLNRGIHP